MRSAGATGATTHEKNMRIAITGAAGQLGQALRQTLGTAHEIVPLNHADLALEGAESIGRIVATGAELVVHPAAYTNVDGCARDPQLAYRVNTLGTKHVALACRQLGAPLVYVSTNEVFDGRAATPYFEYDQPAPVNAYGRSKWGGEQVVRELLDCFYITRVAWLFGGERNFIRTVLRLAAERGELQIVADEIGSPTYAPDAAAAIAQLIQQPNYGTYHIVNEGHCSRFALAAETLRLANASARLTPIRLSDFKRDSFVPPYTALHNEAAAVLGITLRPWQAALAEYLEA
jgi:dTDP-4-dehydrorhamnose reductase